MIIGRLALLFVTVLFAVQCGSPTLLPTLTPAPPPTATPIPTATPMPIPTATPMPIPTATPMPIPTATPMPIPTATPMPIPTATPMPIPTATPVPVYQEAWNRLPNAPWIDWQHPDLAAEIKALAWMEDGVGPFESTALEELTYLAGVSPMAARTVVEYGWVRDGITGADAKGIDLLVSYNDATTAAAVVGKSWVSDGVDGHENNALQELVYFDGTEVSRLLGMPFLQTVEPHDVAALDALYQLTLFDKEVYRRVTSMPTLEDGITDVWARVVTTLTSVVKAEDPELLERALTPTSVSIEERTVVLPLAGDTSLTLVRIDVDGSDESIEIARDVLFEVESVMGTPLPTSYVGLLIADGGWLGHNAWTHVAITPEPDEEPDVDVGLRHLLTHEFAHYYWRSNEDWIDEGIANTLADLHELRVTGRDTYKDRYFSCQLGTIQEIAPDVYPPDFCAYDLGTQLFTELHGVLGDGPFREGLRALYGLTLTEPGAGIEELKAAFADVGEDADAALTIIDRWYMGKR